MSQRSRIIEVDTDVTPNDLSILGSGAVTAALHRHASIGWIDIFPLTTEWSRDTINPFQFRVTADGFLELRGLASSSIVASDIITIANIPIDDDLTQATILEPHSTVWTTVRPTDIPEQFFLIIDTNVTSGSTAIRFQPLEVNKGKVRGTVKFDGFYYPLLTPCLTKIWCIGDEFMVGSLPAIVGESGLSTIGATFNILGFDQDPPVQVGQTIANVFEFLTRYLTQIIALPGPVQVIMTIGTEEQTAGTDLSQIAGSIDTIVSTILDSRPDIVVIFAGYSDEVAFPSDFIALLRSATNHPGRFEYIDLYDVTVEQINPPTNPLPSELGHQQRMAALYERITIIDPQTLANACP